MIKVEELSALILEVIELKMGKELVPEQTATTRLALGLALSSIHSAIIYSATSETKEEAAYHCLDTIQRLMNSLKKDVQRADIPGLSIPDEAQEKQTPVRIFH